jgi:hypothetical protein
VHSYTDTDRICKKKKNKPTILPEKAVVGREHAPVEGHHLGILVVGQDVVEGQVTNLNKKKVASYRNMTSKI